MRNGRSLPSGAQLTPAVGPAPGAAWTPPPTRFLPNTPRQRCAPPEKPCANRPLRTVQGDADLPRLPRVEPGLFPRQEANALQQAPRHVPQAAEQLRERPAEFRRQPP